MALDDPIDCVRVTKEATRFQPGFDKLLTIDYQLSSCDYCDAQAELATMVTNQ